MTVHVIRCRGCRLLFTPQPRALPHWLRALAVSLPVVLIGAVAAAQRPECLLICVLGMAMWAIAIRLHHEPCPHCHSLRTSPRRIPYLTVVR